MQVRGEGSSPQAVSLMAREGAKAFKETMTTMSLEVPLLTLAEEFMQQTEALTCLEIFQLKLGLLGRQADDLCQRTSYFRFDDDRFESALAVVNVYLYGDKFNPKYSREFSQTIWPDDEKIKLSENQITDFEEITLASLAAAAATLATEDEDDFSAFDQRFYSPIELAGIAATIAAIESPEDTDFIVTAEGSGDMQWIASKPE